MVEIKWSPTGRDKCIILVRLCKVNDVAEFLRETVTADIYHYISRITLDRDSDSKTGEQGWSALGSECQHVFWQLQSAASCRGNCVPIFLLAVVAPYIISTQQP